MAEYADKNDKWGYGSSKSPAKSLEDNFTGKSISVRSYGVFSKLKKAMLVCMALGAVGVGVKELPAIQNDGTAHNIVASINHMTGDAPQEVMRFVGIDTRTNGQRALAEAEANKDKSPEGRMIYDALLDLEKQPGFKAADEMATNITNGRVSEASNESTPEVTQTASMASDTPKYNPFAENVNIKHCEEDLSNLSCGM